MHQEEIAAFWTWQTKSREAKLRLLCRFYYDKCKAVIVCLQAHVRLLEVADSVTLEEVNAIGASVLSYISHYRKEAELLEEVGHDPSQNGYALWGPTRMTSIVACIPAFMDASGQSTGDFV